MLCNYTSNYYTIEVIGHLIKPQFRRSYHLYEIMAEESNLNDGMNLRFV